MSDDIHPERDDVDRPDINAIRISIVEEITRAFDGVAREDGVTLHQTRAMDDCDGPEEELAARQLDTESRWQDVPVDDMDEYSDIFAFLDPKGFRYYLPAYMIRALTGDTPGSGNISEILAYTLVPNSCMPQDMWAVNDDNDVLRFRLLNRAQSHAVYRFLQFQANYEQDEEARLALDRYWGRFRPRA